MTDALIPRPRTQVADGAVHLPDWLHLDTQRRLVLACREWARPGRSGGAGLRTVRLPGGGVMSVRMACLGWHWYPYGYARTVRAPGEPGDGVSVPPLPGWLAGLGRGAVQDAYRDPELAYEPDIALVNYYDATAKMGQHQDKDERSPRPVVSFSLGDSCVFRFGNTQGRGRPYADIELRSGDAFVFGGPSRLAYHGVPRTLPGTGDPAIGLPNGRLNLTLRVSGLDG